MSPPPVPRSSSGEDSLRGAPLAHTSRRTRSCVMNDGRSENLDRPGISAKVYGTLITQVHICSLLLLGVPDGLYLKAHFCLPEHLRCLCKHNLGAFKHVCIERVCAQPHLYKESVTCIQELIHTSQLQRVQQGGLLRRALSQAQFQVERPSHVHAPSRRLEA